MKIVDWSLLGRCPLVTFCEHLDEVVLDHVRADALGLPHGVLSQAAVLASLVDECLRHGGDGGHDVDLRVKLGSLFLAA